MKKIAIKLNLTQWKLVKELLDKAYDEDRHRTSMLGDWEVDNDCLFFKGLPKIINFIEETIETEEDTADYEEFKRWKNERTMKK